MCRSCVVLVRKSPSRPGPSSRLLRWPTSKSWLMPIESSRSRSAGTPAAASRSRTSRSRAEPGPRVFRVFDQRRQQHQAHDARRRARAAPRREWPAASSTGAPCLVGFEREIDLHQHLDGPPGRGRRRVDPLQQVDAVDRVNRRAVLRGLSAPCSTAGGRSGATGSSCRSTARSSAGLPGRGSRRSRAGRRRTAARTASMGKVLETAMRRTSAGWRPARAAASAMRARISVRRSAIAGGSRASELQSRTWHSARHGRYFFSCASIAFACAANWPSGASYRYFSNDAIASGSLPSLSSAIPNWKFDSGWFGFAFSASSNLALASGILPWFQRMMPWL